MTALKRINIMDEGIYKCLGKTVCRSFTRGMVLRHTMDWLGQLLACESSSAEGN